MAITMCEECGQEATHILVDYHHNVIKRRDGSPFFYCAQHAFEDERESCFICSRHADETTEYDGVEYFRSYAAGQIDGEGCCSDHP